MARKTMWAVAGALLAFAPFAAAQANYDIGYVNAKQYAQEVISSGDIQIDYRGAAADYRSGTPTIVFTIGQDNAAGKTMADGIEEDDTIDVTFTLANARFASAVRSGDVQLEGTATVDGVSRALGVSGVDANSCDLRVADTIDGARGDNSVTFRIEASDGDCACTSACSFRTRIPFSLPRLYGLNRGAVSVNVTTDRPGGSGWPSLSETGSTTWTGRQCIAANAMGTCTNIDDGVAQLQTPVGENGRRSAMGIITFHRALTFSGTSGGSTRINLAAERRTFANAAIGNQAHLGTVTVGVASAAACTGADSTPLACNLQASGRPFSIARSGEGQGDLEVSVAGDFRNGDTVYLDMDGNGRPSTGESLSLVGGSMAGAFNLLTVAGNPSAGDGDDAEMDREEGVATRNLFYAPNGRDPLRPGGYRTSWLVDFSGSATDKGSTPASSETNTHETSYTVVEDDQVAYAIPPGTTGDVGNVRIKCDVATQCTVYLECDHADGRTWFEQVADPIPGRSTLVLTSEGMRTALGMDDDEWTRGRLSCTVYSTREISLQVLTRSDSGVLVNNTYVDDE